MQKHTGLQGALHSVRARTSQSDDRGSEPNIETLEVAETPIFLVIIPYHASVLVSGK